MRQILCVTALLLVGVCTTSAAFACSPAPDHRIESLELNDAPECVEINDAYSFGFASVNVVNGCEFDLELSQSCDGCEPLTVLAGEEGPYTITEARFSREEETRTFEIELDTGDESVTIDADVTWRDNSDACDGWANQTCSAGAFSQSGSSWIALFGVVLAMGVRRRR